MKNLNKYKNNYKFNQLPHYCKTCVSGCYNTKNYDLNDLSMLLMATKKVVIEGSPKALIDIADEIVLKPQELGVMSILQ